MLALVRSIVYATLFIALLLVFVPQQILASAGIVWPTRIGMLQILGALLLIAGVTLALACVFTFVFLGRGTPAPFDAPRKLVVAGPYRWVRNPMYLSVSTIVLGEVLLTRSRALLVYGVVFFIAVNLFVMLYEEPALRAQFGASYELYTRTVGRWVPRLHRGNS